jgi:hypothetical protein
MKEIKEMISGAPSAREANNMLRMWHGFGKITTEELKKGYKLVKKEFGD